MELSIDAIRRAARSCKGKACSGLRAGGALAERWRRSVRAALAPVDPRWLVALGVVLLVLGAAIVGKLAQRSQAQLIASSQFATHALDVEKRAVALAAAVLEAEEAVRTFLLSGQSTDAEPYRGLRKRLPAEKEELRRLTRDEPVQQAYLDQFDALAGEALDLLAGAIAVNETAGREAALDVLLSSHMARLLEAVRAASSLIALEEQRTLALRQHQLARDAALGRAWLVFVTVVTGFFVLSVWTLAYRQSRLPRLARMCAWSRKIEYEGEWLTFEEYLSRRYHTDITHGISPAEAEKMRTGMSSP